MSISDGQLTLRCGCCCGSFVSRCHLIEVGAADDTTGAAIAAATAATCATTGRSLEDRILLRMLLDQQFQRFVRIGVFTWRLFRHESIAATVVSDNLAVLDLEVAAHRRFEEVARHSYTLVDELATLEHAVHKHRVDPLLCRCECCILLSQLLLKLTFDVILDLIDFTCVD